MIAIARAAVLSAQDAIEAGLDAAARAVANRETVERRALKGGRDQGDLEGIRVDARDGEGDAIDRDGALWDGGIHDLGRCLERDASVAFGFGDPDDCRKPLDVPLHEVPAHQCVGADGMLKIDRVAFLH